MTAEFDALMADAHRMNLCVGPLYETANGRWRAYVQRGTDVFCFREDETLERALEAVLVAVQADEAAVSLKAAARVEDMLA